MSEKISVQFQLRTSWLICSAICGLLLGCDSRSKSPATSQSATGDSTGRATSETITVYASVDPEFARPILDEFKKRNGIDVQYISDTEAGKTTGLVNRLIAEKASPRADVWWSSEIFGTIQLASHGLLDSYKPHGAEDVPKQYHDSTGLWTATGLRGRVIAYDPSRTKKEDLPNRWCDLASPKYKDRFRMADPRFGTTRGHMATLLALWGEPAMTKFYQKLRDNHVVLTDGNSQSVLHVTRGLADFAATDTDDVIAAKQQGVSIDMIYPDLDSPDGAKKTTGTLWIPCSAALVKGAPHRSAAEKLIDYLVSAEVEEKLNRSDSRNVPVRAALRTKLGAAATGEAQVDYAAAAKVLDRSEKLVTDVLLK